MNHTEHEKIWDKLRMERACLYFEKICREKISVLYAEERSNGGSPTEFLLKLDESYGRIEILPGTQNFNQMILEMLHFSGIIKTKCNSINPSHGYREWFTGWKMLGRTVPSISKTLMELKKSEYTDGEAPVNDSDMVDRYFLDNDGGMLYVYYNPDSDHGGQFVKNSVTYGDILTTSSLTDTTSEFFDMLESRAKQFLLDSGTLGFEECKQLYRSGAHNISGRSEEAMHKLLNAAFSYELQRQGTVSLKKPLKELYKQSPDGRIDFSILPRPYYPPEAIKKWMRNSPYTEFDIAYMVHIRADINAMLVIGKENQILYGYLLR